MKKKPSKKRVLKMKPKRKLGNALKSRKSKVLGILE